MTKWEYQMLRICDTQEGQELEEITNALGADGWKVHMIRCLGPYKNGTEWQLFLERPLQEEDRRYTGIVNMPEECQHDHQVG